MFPRKTISQLGIFTTHTKESPIPNSSIGPTQGPIISSPLKIPIFVFWTFWRRLYFDTFCVSFYKLNLTDVQFNVLCIIQAHIIDFFWLKRDKFIDLGLWTKKLPISSDFSEKNRISVVLEKILGWKNQK